MLRKSPSSDEAGMVSFRRKEERRNDVERIFLAGENPRGFKQHISSALDFSRLIRYKFARFSYVRR